MTRVASIRSVIQHVDCIVLHRFALAVDIVEIWTNEVVRILLASVVVCRTVHCLCSNSLKGGHRRCEESGCCLHLHSRDRGGSFSDDRREDSLGLLDDRG